MTIRIALALSAVPLAVAGLTAMLPTTPPASKGDRIAMATAKSVQTIQFVRDDAAGSFAQDWPVVSQAAPPLPEARPFQAGPPALPPRAAEPARKIRRKPAGLCARHDLRKVWVSSTHWRCRR